MLLAGREPGGNNPTVQELAAIGLFSGLDDATIGLLADRLPICCPAEGETIYREGDSGRALYVVLSGEVEVLKRTRRGNDLRLSRLRSGHWFGEMSLLDVMARPVTVRALAPSRLVKVCPPDLDAVYRSSVKMYALLTMNIARQLSRKLRHTVRTVIEQHENGGD